MKLKIYDADLRKVADVGEQFTSCLWQEKYNQLGRFTLSVPETDFFKTRIRPDYYVRRQDRRTVMVIRTVQVKNKEIIAEGFSALNVFDDVAFIGTIQEGQPIAQALKTAYNESSQYPHFFIMDSPLTDTFKHQISNKSIWGLAETMCKSEDVGVAAALENGNIGMKLYKPGVNKNAVFSELIGNIGDPDLTLSTSKYKNVAIVLGEGKEKERVRVDVDLSNGEPRRELIVDARDLTIQESETLEDYKKRLEARGAEKLLTQKKTWKCALNPSSDDFGKSFDLGDIVTVTLQKYGLKFHTRISAFEQKAQKNKVTTKIEVGELTFIER